jgi:3-oxoacyl-[acyl-carrier-protein] synthase I
VSSEGYIVALGARTPLGLTAESSAAAVRAAISRVREHPFIIDMNGDPRVLAFDSLLDMTLFGWKRMVALAASALSEVLGKIGSHAGALSAGRGVPVLLALPESRPGFGEADERQTAEALRSAKGDRSVDLELEICGRGHAGVLHGIEVARARLQTGRSEICIVGGVDSYLESDTLDWLESARRIRVQGVRSGFPPGEAAAFVALATAGGARSLSLPVLARFRGACTSAERCLIDSDEEVLGHGLTDAIKRAAASLGVPGEAIDMIYCDINGERYRNDEWAFTALRTHQFIRDSAYVAPADCWGDVGAASGALGCVLAVRAWARGYAQGPRALIWAGSDHGLRGAAVLEAART